MITIAEKIKEKNLKVTPQRIAIYEMLLNTCEHPCADTIYRRLEENFPAMSLATVYKTLDTFKNIGLVQELNIGEDSFRYDANCTPHPHFYCSCCKSVFDLPQSDSVAKVKQDYSQSTGFEITSEQLYLYGKCKNCLES